MIAEHNDHDRKVNDSAPNVVSLLRPWIRCFTVFISAWWNLESSERSQKKFQPENLEASLNGPKIAQFKWTKSSHLNWTCGQKKQAQCELISKTISGTFVFATMKDAF